MIYINLNIKDLNYIIISYLNYNDTLIFGKAFNYFELIKIRYSKLYIIPKLITPIFEYKIDMPSLYKTILYFNINTITLNYEDRKNHVGIVATIYIDFINKIRLYFR